MIQLNVIGTPEWRAGVEWAIRLAKRHGARYQRGVGDPRPFAELLRAEASEVPEMSNLQLF